MFNSPLSGTTRVSRYQKSKTNLDFTEARDNERQWHQLGHMQVCTSLQTDNHANTHHSSNYVQQLLLLLLLHPFNGLFSRTAWVSQYQKRKTSLDLNEARDDGVWDAVALAGPYTNNLHLAPDRQPHQHLISQFLQAGCSS